MCKTGINQQVASWDIAGRYPVTYRVFACFPWFFPCLPLHVPRLSPFSFHGLGSGRVSGTSRKAPIVHRGLTGGQLPSGKLLHSYVKSQFLMGKSIIYIYTWSFSIAMLVYHTDPCLESSEHHLPMSTYPGVGLPRPKVDAPKLETLPKSAHVYLMQPSCEAEVGSRGVETSEGQSMQSCTEAWVERESHEASALTPEHSRTEIGTPKADRAPSQQHPKHPCTEAGVGKSEGLITPVFSRLCPGSVVPEKSNLESTGSLNEQSAIAKPAVDDESVHVRVPLQHMPNWSHEVDNVNPKSSVNSDLGVIVSFPNAALEGLSSSIASKLARSYSINQCH